MALIGPKSSRQHTCLLALHSSSEVLGSADGTDSFERLFLRPHSIDILRVYLALYVLRQSLDQLEIEVSPAS